MPVLYSAGYLLGDEERSPLATEVTGFIQNPFALADFAAAIEAALR